MSKDIRIDQMNVLLCSLQSDLEAASMAMERDRSLLADVLKQLKDEIRSRSWLLDGRGCYEWDDDRYRDEFRYAINAILNITDKLYPISRDWVGCPRDAATIEASRIDWKKRAMKAEQELAMGRGLRLFS